MTENLTEARAREILKFCRNACVHFDCKSARSFLAGIEAARHFQTHFLGGCSGCADRIKTIFDLETGRPSAQEQGKEG